ncbi:MAG: cytochrome c maturation protein CcmE [Alphaproteobacteria bacterium]
MKPKHQRLLFLCVAMVLLVAGSLVIAQAFRNNLIFFYTPTELDTAQIAVSRPVRIGGLVKQGSLIQKDNGGVEFVVTDGRSDIGVRYDGMLPALFREGQGVVIEGYVRKGDAFSATRVLTKHDENYMPKEVVDSLKKSGRWQDGK